MTDEDLIRIAQENYADPSDDNIIIQQPGADGPVADGGTIVDRTETGAWVWAWVWVAYEDA